MRGRYSARKNIERSGVADRHQFRLLAAGAQPDDMVELEGSPRRLPQHRGELANRRSLEQRRQAEPAFELRLDPGDQMGREQGVPAKLEKVRVRANIIRIEQTAPNR